jgi:hypothetical protein
MPEAYGSRKYHFRERHKICDFRPLDSLDAMQTEGLRKGVRGQIYHRQVERKRIHGYVVFAADPKQSGGGAILCSIECGVRISERSSSIW